MTDQPPPPANDFYVGYLPLPPAHARSLKRIIPAALFALAGIAVFVASLQRDPGPAEWRADVVTVRGTLHDRPYPLILTPDSRVVLLVEQGKHGASPRAQPMRGRAVVARGLELARDQRIILELLPDPSALTIEDPRAAPSPPLASPVESIATLTGEIIDSKCYHGAMKPGQGKTHKACATLCIRNGIPAMFLAESGGVYLFSTDAPVLDEDSLSKIGERVEVTGVVTEVGDLQSIRIQPGTVRRVPAP